MYSVNANSILESMWQERTAIFRNLVEKQAKLADYEFLQNNLRLVDVSSDENYQRKFNDFYKMRSKPNTRYTVFFKLLEEYKNHSNIEFEGVPAQIIRANVGGTSVVLLQICCNRGPSKPIYDSVVMANLGLRVSWYKDSSIRIEKALDNYQELKFFHTEAANSEQFPKLLFEFDNIFHSYRHFAPTKKIDLMLWQWRSKSIAEPKSVREA